MGSITSICDKSRPHLTCYAWLPFWPLLSNINKAVKTIFGNISFGINALFKDIKYSFAKAFIKSNIAIINE